MRRLNRYPWAVKIRKQCTIGQHTKNERSYCNEAACSRWYLLQGYNMYIGAESAGFFLARAYVIAAACMAMIPIWRHHAAESHP